SVTLMGTGSAPAVSLTPASLSFGNQLMGSSSPGQPITLTNTGTSLSITSITTTGDFGQTNNCGAVVSAGASCTITVTFTPTATGARSGSVSISDNASDSPQAVTLSGTGVAPGLSFSPTSVFLGATVLNSTSVKKTVTLTNSGTGMLN